MLEQYSQLPLPGDFLRTTINPYPLNDLIAQYKSPPLDRGERQLTLDEALMNHLLMHDLGEYQKRKYGCVMRAIQSLAGSKIPEPVWDVRLKQILQNPEPLMELILGEREPQDLEEELDWLQLREEDSMDIWDLLLDLKNSKTPLGDALSKFTIKNKLLGIEAMKMSLLEGNEILLLTLNHLAHINYEKKDNTLRSKSDENFEVFLERGAFYQTFVFSRKKPKVSFFRRS